MSKFLNKATVAIATQVVMLGFVPQEELRAATFRLEEATVDSINEAFDSGELTSQELTQLYIDRINAYDNNGPNINSIITTNPQALEIAAELDIERQLKGPRSPLHGIPVILKDNYDTFDLPTTGGSITLEGSIPPDDAFTVKQLRDAGAVIFAKANLSEFALTGGRQGYSSLGGRTLNPYNLNRSPAGSSGGSGAAIAANFGVIGTGSDTGGSIRGPAAVNSLVGVKPTLGLVSRDGIIPLALSFDTGGPLTRTVKDAAITLGVMTGVDPNDPVTLESSGKFYKDYTQFLDKDALKGARIGVLQDFLGANSEVDQTINTAIQTIGDLGATVVDSIDLSDDFLEKRSEISDIIFDSEFQSQFETYLLTLDKEYPKTLEEVLAISKSPEVVNSGRSVAPGRIEAYEEALASGGLTNPDYIDAIENGIPFVRNTLLEIIEENDLDSLIYPTRTCPAAPIETIEDPTYVCDESVPSPTNLANITGFPDVQVPAGFTEDGLPISLSFFGEAYSEPDLLGFAYAYEQATMNRRPSPLVPPLPTEPVPEPRSTAAVILFGLVALSLKVKQQRKKGDNKFSANSFSTIQGIPPTTVESSCSEGGSSQVPKTSRISS